MTDVKNGLKWLFWIFKENPNYTQMSVCGAFFGPKIIVLEPF